MKTSRSVVAMASLVLADAASASPHAVAVELGKQFDTHAVVLIGEHHRNVQQHEFFQMLLHDRVFICRADDVVVESGNSRFQDIADRYVAGESVSETELQNTWRETAVPFAWNSPLYRKLLDTVREINAKHLCKHSVRAVLADAPLDWSTVETSKQLEAFADRDTNMAVTLEREVLAKHRHAFMITGEAHAVREGPKNEDGSAADPSLAKQVEAKYPGAVFSAVFVPPEAAKTWKLGRAPSFRLVRGSAFENASFAIVAPTWNAKLVATNGTHVWQDEPAEGWARVGNEVDGLINIGGDETSLYPAPTIYLEPAYQRELRRRVLIVKGMSGQEFDLVLDDLIKDAEKMQKAGNR